MIKLTVTLSKTDEDISNAVALELHRKGYQFKYGYFTPELERVMGFQGEQHVPSDLYQRVHQICNQAGVELSLTE